MESMLYSSVDIYVILNNIQKKELILTMYKFFFCSKRVCMEVFHPLSL